MATHADTHPMVSGTETVDTAAELQGLEDSSKKGWHEFTKFLLGNVILSAAALLILGLLTVWS